MRVRASRPSFWVGQTYDNWNGQSWVQSAPTRRPGVVKLDTGSPFEIPLGSRTRQAARSSGDDRRPDLLPGPVRTEPGVPRRQRPAGLHPVPLPLPHRGRHHRVGRLDGVRAPSTPWSPTTTPPPPQQLRGPPCPGRQPGAAADALSPAQPPATSNSPTPTPGWPRWPARSPPASAPPGDPDPHTYDKVEAIEQWMSTHVQYTTDIPPLAPGADAVNSFLFGTRRGYCEQISTATVVMLRSLGIPARETVGYVPGSYNPITDLYDVAGQGRPRLGAGVVPRLRLAELRPHRRRAAGQPVARLGAGPTAAGRTLAHLPWIPIGVVVGLVGTVARSPPAPAAAPGHLGPPGRRRPRAGRSPPGPQAAGRRDPVRLRRAAGRGDGPRRTGLIAATAAGRALHLRRRWSRRPTRSPPPWPSPGGSGPARLGGRQPTGGGSPHDRDSASASSNEAPAASSGR